MPQSTMALRTLTLTAMLVASASAVVVVRQTQPGEKCAGASGQPLIKYVGCTEGYECKGKASDWGMTCVKAGSSGGSAGGGDEGGAPTNGNGKVASSAAPASGGDNGGAANGGPPSPPSSGGPPSAGPGGDSGGDSKGGEGGKGDDSKGGEGGDGKGGEGGDGKGGEGGGGEGEGGDGKGGEGGDAKGGEEGGDAKGGEEGGEAKDGEEGGDAKGGEEGGDAKAGEEGGDSEGGEGDDKPSGDDAEAPDAAAGPLDGKLGSADDSEDADAATSTDPADEDPTAVPSTEGVPAVTPEVTPEVDATPIPRVEETPVATAESSGSVCFPGDATVELEDGSMVPMAELSIGDSVKVGLNQFSKVFMFTHKMSDVVHKFVTLETSSGASLALTKGHYIYADGALVAAGDVQIGSQVRLGSGATDTVVAVGSKISSGLYNPQTVNGDVVVNGIVSSTYTTAVEPSFAHAILAPFRFMNSLGLHLTALESGSQRLADAAPSGAALIF